MLRESRRAGSVVWGSWKEDEDDRRLVIVIRQFPRGSEAKGWVQRNIADGERRGKKLSLGELIIRVCDASASNVKGKVGGGKERREEKRRKKNLLTQSVGWTVLGSSFSTNLVFFLTAARIKKNECIHTCIRVSYLPSLKMRKKKRWLYAQLW